MNQKFEHKPYLNKFYFRLIHQWKPYKYPYKIPYKSNIGIEFGFTGIISDFFNNLNLNNKLTPPPLKRQI